VYKTSTDSLLYETDKDPPKSKTDTYPLEYNTTKLAYETDKATPEYATTETLPGNTINQFRWGGASRLD
jgi:hypothetical protein